MVPMLLMSVACSEFRPKFENTIYLVDNFCQALFVIM